MGRRKSVVFLGLALFLCALFYQPLAKAVVGAGVRSALKWNGCGFAYRSIAFEKGRVVFAEPVLFDRNGEKSSFHARAERASLLFDFSQFPRKLKGRLQVDSPSVSLLSPRIGKGGKSGWFDLQVDIRDGTVEWPGLERAHFFYEKAAVNQVGKLKLKWVDSDLCLEAIEESGGWKIDLDLKEIKASFLESMLGFYAPEQLKKIAIDSGQISGSIYLSLKEGVLQEASCRIETKDLGFQAEEFACSGVNLKLDWEGPLKSCSAAGLLGDFLPFSEEGRLRASIGELNFISREAMLEHLHGEISYNPKMGARWEIESTAISQGKQFPFRWEGRGYFHEQMDNWLESAIGFGEQSGIEIGAHEKEKERVWTFRASSFQSEMGTLLQTLAAARIGCGFIHFQNGVLSLNAELYLKENSIEFWTIPHFAADNLSVSAGDFEWLCQKAEGSASSQGGEISLAGGEFNAIFSGEKKISGRGWSGACSWTDRVINRSAFSGKVEGVEVGLELLGAFSDWRVEAVLAGGIEGRISSRWALEGGRLNLEVDKGLLEGLAFEGGGWIENGSFYFGADKFCGKVDWLSRFSKDFSIEGNIVSHEKGFFIEGDRFFYDWFLQAKVDAAKASYLSKIHFENVKTELLASSSECVFYSTQGDWIIPQGKIGIDSPMLKKVGSDWDFDIRCRGKNWDPVRLAGVCKGLKIAIDQKKSHFFGAPLYFEDFELDESGELAFLDVKINLPWSSICAADPLLKELHFGSWSDLPFEGTLALQVHYAKEGGSEVLLEGAEASWKGDSIALNIHGLEKEGFWEIDRFECADLSASFSLQKEALAFFRIQNGKGSWGEGIETAFEGKIGLAVLSDMALSCSFRLEKMQLDLAEIGSLSSKIGMPLGNLEGLLDGNGHLSYNGQFEADLDFSSQALKAGSLELENQGPIHLYCSSEKGIFFSGLDLLIAQEEVNCKVELLQYDTQRSHWIFNRSSMHLPADFLGSFFSRGPAFLKALDPEHDLDFIADFDCASDFSSINGVMQEGFIPIGGAVRHLKNLELVWNKKGVVSFDYIHEGVPIRMGLDVDFSPQIEGRLTLEDKQVALLDGERPLAIDWKYIENKGISIEAIEGVFGGVDASFHAQNLNRLIGSARLNFQSLCRFLSPDVAEVFQDLKMGRGYELKGHLAIDQLSSSFRGILSGKQIDLFGYQFRTLLAQVDLSSEKMRIYDLKISDSSGTMKVDEIVLEGRENIPWTISIPQIAVREFRPSLLQKPGEALGPISPLVVRELKIVDFKGLLDDGSTYTAKGQLNFINSFKREHTVFDIPSDVLSRIVGLDLDLLIPVRGTLSYELKDGLFRFTALKGAFSEGERSEFFLVSDGLSPCMDLDGNLKIFVQMKQFVLFKLTEAFLISIDGTLGDPKFHLQKKRGFLGL